MPSSNGKDTIYIDVDDEITTVIDKVSNAKSKIVALVLPKRATTFQSSVNMKLLKRTADEAKKKVVLITSEPGLLPLAAAAGLHVASTLQSKPELARNAGTDATAASSSEDFNPESAGDRSIGELAEASGVAVPSLPAQDDIETLDIEDETPAAGEGVGETAATAAATTPKKPKNKKLHIPNFEKFRLLLALGIVLLIALGVGLYYAVSVLPKAVVDVKTDSTTLASNLNLTLDTTANTMDPIAKIVPAKTEQEQKTSSQQAPATGQQNNGQKASGTVTMAAEECSIHQPADVPAGTGISANGFTYITQEDTSFSSAPQIGSNNCLEFQADSPTPVIAQSAGAKYNITATSYSVAGRSDVTATSSNGMTGGTDKIVKVVSQSDIDTAQKKLKDEGADTAKQDLAKLLQQDGLFAITATFAAGTPSYTNDAQVGDTADTVTVTQTVTYTMYGAKKSDLQQLVDADVKQQIDPSKQSILSEGLDTATFKVTNTATKSVDVSLSTTAIAGPDLKTADIKKQIEGKKSGEVQTVLQANPGITNVTVRLSPFWVTHVPKNPDKITVNLSKPTAPPHDSSTP